MVRSITLHTVLVGLLYLLTTKSFQLRIPNTKKVSPVFVNKYSKNTRLSTALKRRNHNEEGNEEKNYYGEYRGKYEYSIDKVLSGTLTEPEEEPEDDDENPQIDWKDLTLFDEEKTAEFLDEYFENTTPLTGAASPPYSSNKEKQLKKDIGENINSIHYVITMNSRN